jgi:hypothetical protein
VVVAVGMDVVRVLRPEPGSAVAERCDWLSARVRVLLCVGPCDGVVGCRGAFRCLATIDDLARWELCGISSIWRSPTARRPRGSPRRDRRRSGGALPLGCRVVARGEIDGMPHPAIPTEPGLELVLAISEICPPGEGTLC